MTKWSARGTGNPAGPGLESRSGHLLDLFSVVPILNPRPCQVLNRKLFVFCSFEGLNISAADCTQRKKITVVLTCFSRKTYI